jgi:hypothetical protein
MEGCFYRFIGGDAPRELQEFLQERKSDSADPRDIITIDAGLMLARMRRAAPAAEKPPQRITKNHLLKRFAWSDEEFETAKRCGLPRPHERIVDNALWLEPRREFYWDGSDIERWIGDMKAVAKGLRS